MKIIFVCLGNICRSPMAEYIFKSLDTESKFEVSSAGISNEEYGNDIYPKAKTVLNNHGIKYNKHFAHKITEEEFRDADYVVVMEEYQKERLNNIYNSDKIIKLLDNDIDDPWYTGKFEEVYDDIYFGCISLYNKINNS